MLFNNDVTTNILFTVHGVFLSVLLLAAKPTLSAHVAALAVSYQILH